MNTHVQTLDTPLFPPTPGIGQPTWRLCIFTALVYVVSARVGQVFSIEPGNVTPVWLPSGLMVAAVLCWGRRIWPGIFLGAFLGNAWAYWSWESLELVSRGFGSAFMNGTGDALGIVLLAWWMLRHVETRRCLRSRRGLLLLAIPVAWGSSVISAFFGAGGLWLFGYIGSDQTLQVFFTWMVGDAVGVLVMAPLALSWMLPHQRENTPGALLMLAVAAYSVLLALLLFEMIRLSGYWAYLVTLMVPPLFYVLFNQGERLVFTVLFLVSVVAVWATSVGQGPFAGSQPESALLELQLFIGIFSLSLFAMALLGFEQQDARALLQQRQVELERLYRQDALTGVWNRYRIKEFLELELARFRRGGSAFGVILIDIDNFKHINDEMGHLVGDEVLKSLSLLLSEHIREHDLLGRWGGEEFIVIVTDTDQASVMVLAEKLRALIEGADLSLRKVPVSRISISLGVTLAEPGDSEMRLLDRADSALYCAKQAGKNQVTSRWAE